MRDLQKRIRELTVLWKADPNSVDKQVELAEVFAQAGRHDDALGLFRQAIDICAERGSFVQAIAVGKLALALRPDDPTLRQHIRDLVQKRDMASARRPRGLNLGPGAPSNEPEMSPLPSSSGITASSGARSVAGGSSSGSRSVPPPSSPLLTPRPSSGVRSTGLTDGHTDTTPSAAAPPDGAIELMWEDDEPENQTLSDGALQSDPQASAARPTLARGQSSAEGRALFPLFAELPENAFVELMSRLSLIHLDAGVVVLREGEAGDACYLISSGSVRVTKGGVELARLGAGSFFGEFAVLADQRRHASVETLEPVQLLEVRRALLDELVAEHPGVARTLRNFYQARLLGTLLSTAPFFAELTTEEREDIAARFRPRRFGRGANIIDEGQAGSGLFLVLIGEVAVVRGGGGGGSPPDTKGEIILATLSEGSYFGEMSLLRGGVASATVRAVRTTELVQLPPREFYEVVSLHPSLWDQLRVEAERREMANHQLLTGDARRSADGSVYIV